MGKIGRAIVKTGMVWVAGAAALMAWTAGVAQDGPPAVPGQLDASRVSGGTYGADPAHSLVGWRVGHLGFNDYLGLFGGVDGTLVLDPTDPSRSRVDVTVPVADVTVASQGLRDHLLRPARDGGSPDFFGADPPPARFRSTRVEPGPGQTATITGELTLNGVTRPVAVAARFTGAGVNPRNQRETVGFEGTATIRRSDFGLSYAVPMIGDEVELDLTAAFEKTG